MLQTRHPNPGSFLPSGSFCTRQVLSPDPWPTPSPKPRSSLTVLPSSILEDTSLLQDFFETKSQFCLELTNSDRMVSQKAPGIHQSLPLQCLDHRYTPPCLALFARAGIELRSLCLCHKCLTDLSHLPSPIQWCAFKWIAALTHGASMGYVELWQPSPSQRYQNSPGPLISDKSQVLFISETY